jgi:hypothetical protein
MAWNKLHPLGHFSIESEFRCLVFLAFLILMNTSTSRPQNGLLRALKNTRISSRRGAV